MTKKMSKKMTKKMSKKLLTQQKFRSERRRLSNVNVLPSLYKKAIKILFSIMSLIGLTVGFFKY